jgi:lysophospholipase L1-like esterase
MKPWKLFAVQLALCAALTLAALGALELYLRLTIPASSGESIYEYTLASKRYKVMKRDASIIAWGKDLRTNQLGFRDRESTVAPKRRGEFRIIVLGDSFTVSTGVDYALIYTTLLEANLKKQRPEVRVLNLAVGGYNIVQYAAVLEEVGLALDPDMVLVSLFPENDFSMETYEKNYRAASGEAPDTDAAWHETLYVYRAYLRRAEQRIRKWLPPQAQPAAANGWEENLVALRSLAELARARNIVLAVAILPSTWNLPQQRPLFGRLERYCASQGLVCLNLLEPLIGAGVEAASLRLNVVDAHPSEKYNALVAEHLTPFVEKLLAPQ